MSMEPFMYGSTAFVQLTLAVLLGAILGFERILAGKEAGVRTFALVSMGSCLFVIIGELMVGHYRGIADIDPSRIASSIVTGVGFIGAGLIIFQHELKGLTTAATLWVTSAIGAAVGFHLYLIATFATFLALFVTVCLWFVEHALERKVARRVRK